MLCRLVSGGAGRMFGGLIGAGVLSAAVLSACATPRSAPGIRDGMTVKEVVAILGMPDRVSKRGRHYTAYQYHQPAAGHHPLGVENYIVIFKDGRAEARGPGRLRENPGARMGMFVIIPLK